MAKLRRPLLRYPGGKWKISRWIIENLPPHNYYVEPYGGAGSVLLRKPKVQHEVLNDIDKEVLNVFRVMQNPRKAKRLLRKLKYTPFSREEYYLSRKKSIFPVEQARRTITRSFQAFGTTGTFIRNAGFKASSFYEHGSSGRQWADLSDQLFFYTERLSEVILECRPALKIIAQQDNPKTLFYIDPPYVRGTRYHEDVYRHEMDDDDHRELAKVLHDVEAMVVLSGYHSELYNELYGDWEIREKDAIIASPAGNNRRVEVLYLNPACSRNKYPLFENGGSE